MFSLIMISRAFSDRSGMRLQSFLHLSSCLLCFGSWVIGCVLPAAGNAEQYRVDLNVDFMFS